MRTIKKLLRKIPPIRWADDFTDTPAGQRLVIALWAAFVLLVLVYAIVSGLPHKLP
jgi:hypothetical protein